MLMSQDNSRWLLNGTVELHDQAFNLFRNILLTARSQAERAILSWKTHLELLSCPKNLRKQSISVSFLEEA